MAPATTRIRVVLAEDHADLRFLIREQLHIDGRFVVVGEASDGNEATSLTARHRPDLVLLDVQMPGTSGLEAIPTIKEVSPGTYIVMLSGQRAEGIEESALALGADWFLDKEASIPTMGTLLADLMDKHREEDSPQPPSRSLLHGLSVEDVVALIVHELRTPMTVLKGVGARLETSIAEMNEGQIRVLAGLLHSNLRRMNELLESLDDLPAAGAESPANPYSRVRLDELVREAADALQLLADGREVAVRTVPAEVRGDPVRVRQIVDNLLQNALRYGEGPIDISMSTSPPDLELRIRDHGPGIEPDQRERLFARFARGATVEGEGIGLGLFIARQIAEAHGGTLAYEDPTRGSGACFLVRLPLAEEWPV